MARTEEKTQRVVAYTRVSRMAENKMSTQSQIQEIKRFCDFNKYELVKVYSDEDLSGSETQHRVNFNRMFEDIRLKTYGDIDIVICYNLSRFSRSIKDINTYTHILKNDLNCGFRSVQESFIDTSNAMGTFLLNVFGAIAQLERDRLISVISDSNVNRAKSGNRWTNGGIPPYGYIRQNRTIIPDPETSENVKKVFQMFVVDKIPLSTIAKKFNRAEIDPNRPDQDVSIYRSDKRMNELNIPVAWNPSRIRRILDNPCYAGINVTNRRKKSLSANGNKTSHINNDPTDWIFSNNLKINRLDTENFWNSDFEILGYDIEPLIDWDLFVQAQKLRLENQKCEAVREKTNYLLKDLLYCGKCGRRMNGSVNHRDIKRTYYYYRCNRRNYLTDCDMESVHCSVVDNYVMAALSDSFILMMIDDIVQKENGKLDEIVAKYKEEQQAIKKEIEKCETAILNLVESIKLSSTLDMVKETLIEEINRETSKKERLEKDLTKLRLKSETEERTQADIDGFVTAWKNADFDKMSFDLRREFFVKYIDRVVYYSPTHIDIYVKINRTPQKLDFTKEQLEKIQYKLAKKAEKKQSSKIYKVVNRFLERLKNADISRFEWMWHFVDEPL